MSDVDPWSAAAQASTPPAWQGRPRWVLPALIAVLVLVLLAGAWVVAARQGVQAFDHAAGEPAPPPCGSELTSEDVRPEFLTPMDVPPELEVVADAFTTYFAQDRWSYTDTFQEAGRSTPGSEIRFTVDGEVFERREPDGFVGLIRPGGSIARFEGDRFWLSTCVNSLTGWQMLDDAGCIAADVDGGRTQVRWANVRDHTCEGAIASMSATLEDGRLVEWTIEIEDRFTSTATVEEPSSLAWPSRIWIVPGWLVGKSG